MGCGADTEANDLLVALSSGDVFNIPNVDLTAPEFQIPSAGDLDTPIDRLTNEDLTTKSINGTGTFDVLMSSFAAHLQSQYEAGRITGEFYAKAYTELTAAAMANAVQYLLGRDQAYWQAVAAQQNAKAAQAAVITARLQAEIAKAQLQTQRYEAQNNLATYSLTKLKLATEDINYCLAKYNLDNMLPAQLELVKEQREAQRAQTLDTRTDDTPIAGSVGKQKDLYSQQIESYKRDSEVKAAKLFTDAWITMKTMDEGLLPPSGFANTSLDEVLTTLKEMNNFGD